MGKWNAPYEKNRVRFATDADHPSPLTFAGAAAWLRENDRADNYLLWVEAFDPHEPCDCPAEFRKLYGDNWQRPRYDWSGYEEVKEDRAATRHLRRCYAATLTMSDQWLGKLLDELDRQHGWADTLVILTTDHGHLLGEHGVTGKNRWHFWRERGNIPLIVHLPGSRHAGHRRGQLTQHTDLLPTLLDYCGIPCPHPVHGESWRPILERHRAGRREVARYGWFGQTANVTDGRDTYFRAPVRDDNSPLYQHFCMATTYHQHDLQPPEAFLMGAELGQFRPYTSCPVLRQKLSRRRSEFWADTRLHDLRRDPGETRNLAGTKLEAKYAKLLLRAVQAASAAPSQYARLGLTP